MNAKRKGARSEHKSRDLLVAAGYRVTKAGGSLGVWDLIGIGHYDIWLCQVKTNRGPSPAERRTMIAFLVPRGVRKEVHLWRDYAREPEITVL